MFLILPMVLIKITSLFILILFLNSCLFSNCNEINLSSKDKQWINLYESIDTLIFQTENKKEQIFILKDKYNDYTTCSKFELGPDVYNYIGIEFWDSINDFTISINLSKDYNHNTKYNTDYYLSVTDLHSTFDSATYHQLNIQNIYLPNKKKLFKTYFFETGDKLSNNNSKIVKSFNWSEKFGLLKYENKKGEVFYFKEFK